jgi:hypothetical protein
MTLIACAYMIILYSRDLPPVILPYASMMACKSATSTIPEGTTFFCVSGSAEVREGNSGVCH